LIGYKNHHLDNQYNWIFLNLEGLINMNKKIIGDNIPMQEWYDNSYCVYGHVSSIKEIDVEDVLNRSENELTDFTIEFKHRMARSIPDSTKTFQFILNDYPLDTKQKKHGLFPITIITLKKK